MREPGQANSNAAQYDARAEAELLRLLMLQTRRVPVSIALMVLVFIALGWGHVPPASLVSWGGLAVTVVVLRALVAHAWLRSETPPPAPAIRHFFIASAAVSGTMAGGYPALFLPAIPPLEMGIVSAIVQGWAAGGIATMSHLRAQYFGFLGASTALLIVGWLRSGVEQSWMVAGLLLLMSLALAFSARDYGRVLRAAAVTRFENLDLVERLQAEGRASREAQAIAEEATRAKSQFLASASHDLRQPVTALSMLAGTLLLRAREPSTLALAQRIDSAVDSLSTLLSGMLDLSRLDAGVVTPKWDDVALLPLVHRLEADLRPIADRRRLQLQFDVAPLALRSDPLLLERLLRNLLENALKFTAEGSVTLRVHADQRQCLFEVIDTGVGIAPEHHQRIFQEYFQVANPGRSRESGLGLGLSIVARLCALLQATIDVCSTPGRGATFVVRHPLRPQERTVTVDAGGIASKPATATSGPPGASVDAGTPVASPTTATIAATAAVPAPEPFPTGRLVMLVDDDAAVREGLRLLLEGWGCRVVSGETVEQALQNAATEALGRPDCVLTDYRLADGTTGLAGIGRIEPALPARSVIVMTGDLDPELQRLADERGHQFEFKPLRRSPLRRRLIAAFEASARA